MTNLDKYKSSFTETFNVENKDLDSLKYQAIDDWDSVGHMSLMASLEEKFEIELDIDDIIEFSSFEVGKKILLKYDVKVD